MSLFDLRDSLYLLMLVPFGIVLGAGILFTISAARWVKEAKLRNQLTQFDIPLPIIPPPKTRPLFLERPNFWIAVKGTDPKKIQATLGLQDATPCSWEEGLVEAKEHKLFISPPVAGWILIVGADLPEPDDDLNSR